MEKNKKFVLVDYVVNIKHNRQQIVIANSLHEAETKVIELEGKTFDSLNSSRYLDPKNLSVAVDADAPQSSLDENK